LLNRETAYLGRFDNNLEPDSFNVVIGRTSKLYDNSIYVL
jgi:hypothetical protein